MRLFSAALAAFGLLAATLAAAETPAPYSNLPGTSWTVIEWNAQAPTPPLVPRLTFDRSGNFSGRAGCNIFSGSYTVHGARIRFEPTGWTKMMCDADRMQMDMRFSADLRRVARLAIGGDGILVAHAEDGAVIFRFRRASPGRTE